MGERQRPITVAIIGAAALIIAAMMTTMLPKTSGPNPAPAPPTTTHSVIDVAPVPPPPIEPDGFPTTKSEVVARFGGTLGEWTPRPPNGWIYRATISGALTFTVPTGCVVDDPGGRHQPGERINATQLTVYCPA